jgi:hypothetical protein
MRRRRDREASEASGTGIEDAFISPDDPIPERREDMSDAFISPDDPIPQRAPVQTVTADEEDEEVTVTGIGDDAHLDPDELQASGDPHVMELTERVAKLAQALKQKGEAGLRATPEMDRFEATLRAYCVGYLAGRRAEDQD